MERDAIQRSEEVHAQLLELVINGGEPLIIVDSPPGAGKTTLVERLVVTAQHVGMRVAVVTPRAEQAFDLVRRLLQDYPVPLELLLARERRLPDDLAAASERLPGRNMWRADDGLRVEVGTVAKLAAFVFGLPTDQPTYDLLVCDEAYQVPYGAIAPLFHLARQVVLVGDPGQLPPLIAADIATFEAARYKVHWALPREIVRRFPDVPRFQLPLTWRLPADTVKFIQPSFYPQLPFAAAVPAGERHLHFQHRGPGDALDVVLDRLASGETLVAAQLPQRRAAPSDVDVDVAEHMARLVERLLTREAVWGGRRRLMPNDIGCVDPHVASGALLRQRLRVRGISPRDVLVDTPEIWQGLQRPLIIVKSPLSGQPRLTAFHLEPGRWCVALSRHKLGCIIVCREGYEMALAQHHHDCADRPMASADAEWAGWSAHQRLWAEMDRSRRLIMV